MKYLEKNKINIDSLKKSHKKIIRNNKSTLKTRQNFKCERRNVFAEEINKSALSLNDNKRMQSFDLTEIYAYKTSEDLVSEKEETKCNNIIKQYKMLKLI